MTAPPVGAGDASVTAEEWIAALTLLARFEEAVDRRDPESFRACFTVDGEISGEMVASADQLERVPANRDAGGPPVMHLTANHVVERVSAGRLRATYLLVTLALSPTAPTVLRANRITDRLQLTSDGWRIRRHHVGAADITASAPRRPDA